MDSPTSVKRVAELSGVDKEIAERVVRATLDVTARGDATTITWIKRGTNFVTPSSTPTWGCSAGARSRARRGLTGVR